MRRIGLIKPPSTPSPCLSLLKRSAVSFQSSAPQIASRLSLKVKYVSPVMCYERKALPAACARINREILLYGGRFRRRAGNDGYCLTGDLCEKRSDSEAVYLMRRPLWSILSIFILLFVDLDRPIDQRNQIDQISATRRERVSGTFFFFWQATPGLSCWPEHRLTAVSGARIINT